MNPKLQAEVLLNELLLFAKKMLNAHGEFYPFGAFLDSSGGVVHIGVQASLGELSPQQRIDSLLNAFESPEIRTKALAIGIASNVTLPGDGGDQVDAIKCFLEHRDGYCAEVFIGYEIVSGGVNLIDTSAQQGMPAIFARPH